MTSLEEVLRIVEGRVEERPTMAENPDVVPLASKRPAPAPRKLETGML